VALVTGASSGIGRAFAVALHARGSDLVLVARRRDRLEELAEGLRSGGSAAVETLVADLTEPSDRALVEERLRDPSRPVDLLVNNAGVGGHGPFARRPIDYEDREIRLNVLAPVHLTSAALPGMIERREGVVANVVAPSVAPGRRGMGAYAASKAALASLTTTLRMEAGGKGVAVFGFDPGWVGTDLAPDGPEEPGPVGERLADHIAAGRSAREPLS